MKNSAIRLIAFLLSLVTLMLGFASCANTGGEETTPTETTATPAGTDAETVPVDTTPTTDEWGRPYVASPTPEGTKLEDGSVITVLIRYSDTWNREFRSETENGDMLNDEIYKRNLKLEEDLNFTFEFITTASKEEGTSLTIAEFESGGSSGIDIVTHYAYYSTGAALRNCYANLHTIDTVNLENPWWKQTYIDAATIKDQLYFVVGDLNLAVVDRSISIYYNATLANDYQIGDLYGTVLDGQWTIDKLIEYTKDTWVDTNQSGAIDMADKIGIIGIKGSEAYDGMLPAFDIDIIGKKDDGGLELVWDTEKVSSAIDLEIQLYNQNNGACLHSSAAELRDKFTNGGSLFWIHMVYADAATNQALRAMNDSYGLLPLPKYNAEQQNYHTAVQDAYSIMSVMSTSKQIEAVGTVLEEWNYRSYMDILPVYCEVIMKNRYLANVESGMIFDIIRNSAKFNTGMIYSSELDGIANMNRDVAKSGVNSFASTYKQKQKIYARKISDLLKYFDGRAQ
ncbi:MAG: hypothetical protein IJY97_04630 [Clostridia bacterium]|nr:hypothetical protein [Clostridia bacterium]